MKYPVIYTVRLAKWLHALSSCPVVFWPFEYSDQAVNIALVSFQTPVLAKVLKRRLHQAQKSLEMYVVAANLSPIK